MGFQQVAYSVTEALSSLRVCASLAELAERDVVVSLSTLSGTAEGMLYDAAERIWSFKANTIS